jgi:signal transduction histidine kinase
VTRKIAEAHGGQVSLASRGGGGGTSVIIALPR